MDAVGVAPLVPTTLRIANRIAVCAHGCSGVRTCRLEKTVQYQKWMASYKLGVHDKKVRASGAPTDGSLKSLGISQLLDGRPEEVGLEEHVERGEMKEVNLTGVGTLKGTCACVPGGGWPVASLLSPEGAS